MKSLMLAFILATCSVSALAETLADKYAAQGRLFIVKLDTAQFPHPDRAKGHDYHTNHYSAEKNYSDNRVGIFVPNNFSPGAQIDFVVHFHGWMHTVDTTLSEYKLIDQFAEAGRNAILIVPQGPYNAADSFGGKFEDADGFKRFMNDVMVTLRKKDVIRSASLGKIILSGHSGGYHVIGGILAKGGLSEHVREVWLFDALYGSTENFVNWFEHHPNGRFIDIYTEHGGTKEESENLMTALKAEQPPRPFFFAKEADATPADLKKNHLVFLYSPLEHNDVMSKNEQFFEWLNTSSLEPMHVGRH